MQTILLIILLLIQVFVIFKTFPRSLYETPQFGSPDIRELDENDPNADLINIVLRHENRASAMLALLATIASIIYTLGTVTIIISTIISLILAFSRFYSAFVGSPSGKLRELPRPHAVRYIAHAENGTSKDKLVNDLLSNDNLTRARLNKLEVRKVKSLGIGSWHFTAFCLSFLLAVGVQKLLFDILFENSQPEIWLILVLSGNLAALGYLISNQVVPKWHVNVSATFSNKDVV